MPAALLEAGLDSALALGDDEGDGAPLGGYGDLGSLALLDALVEGQLVLELAARRQVV